MKRWLAVVGLLLVVVVVWWRVLYASPPVGCVYPNALDNFQAVVPGQHLLAQDYNKILCAVNALERRVGTGSPYQGVRRACTGVSVGPGERKLVTINFGGTPFSGNEAIVHSVKDTTPPSRLESDGLQEVSGTVVKVWVFNHDGSVARTGTACAIAS